MPLPRAGTLGQRGHPAPQEGRLNQAHLRAQLSSAQQTVTTPPGRPAGTFLWADEGRRKAVTLQLPSTGSLCQSGWSCLTSQAEPARSHDAGASLSELPRVLPTMRTRLWRETQALGTFKSQ